MKTQKIAYCPALRMKVGELEGVLALSYTVARAVLPRFIVPPVDERDDPNQYTLIETTAQPDFGGMLAPYWRGRPVLIDPTYIIDEFGRDILADWLPAMFQRARDRDVMAIPAVHVSDLGECETPAFRAAIDSEYDLRFAIIAPFEDILDPTFEAEVKATLERLRLRAIDCAIIADFSAADFSEPARVAPVITATLERLQEVGRWQLVIFQGTNYPETNPADHGNSELWPRNEWKAWVLAVEFNPSTAEHMVFGDFAADCAKMTFGSAGVKAITHLRYATKDSWLVQRGKKDGTVKDEMRAVCNAIVRSGRFAGANFSSADATIAAIAAGRAGPGNAKTWRQLNTTHHLTQVIADIANVRGVAEVTADTTIEVEPY